MQNCLGEHGKPAKQHIAYGKSVERPNEKNAPAGPFA